MTLLVTVETGEMTQVLASCTGYVTGISPARVLSDTASVSLSKSLSRRTRLEDPGLTPSTWPRWYKPDDYLMGNVDPIPHCSIWALNEG